MKKLFNRFSALSARGKTAIIAAIVLIALLASPVVVKAATDGEVDLYAMIMELFARVEEQEVKTVEQDVRVTEQEARLAEQDARIAEQKAELTELRQIIAELPAPMPPATPPPPVPEPESEPTPPPPPLPPPNPYRNCTLSGVHVATLGDTAYFGKWLIDVGGVDVSMIALPIITTREGLVCFTDQARDISESRLTDAKIHFSMSAIPIDPLLVQMVAGKKFGSRTEAINYIEAKIRGE